MTKWNDEGHPLERIDELAWRSGADMAPAGSDTTPASRPISGVNTNLYKRLQRSDPLIRCRILRDFSAGCAVVVGGDFNLHSDQEPDGEILVLLYAEGGLADACTALDCLEATRIDRFPFRDDERVGIRPLSWSNEDARFRTDNGDKLSDHEPVAVTFEWTAW